MKDRNLPQDIDKTEKSGECLGSNGGNRRACASPVQDRDAEHIEEDIEEGGNRKENERCTAVADGTQHSRGHVVKDCERNPEENDEEIRICIIDDVRRRLHEAQNRHAENCRHGRHNDGQRRAQNDGVKHIAPHALPVIRAKTL